MAISYKKLWKLLIDKDMKKKDLQKVAGISAASVTKLGKNENVNTEIIEKICIALQCDVSDIMEMADSVHVDGRFCNGSAGIVGGVPADPIPERGGCGL